MGPVGIAHGNGNYGAKLMEIEWESSQRKWEGMGILFVFFSKEIPAPYDSYRIYDNLQIVFAYITVALAGYYTL